MNLRFGIHPAKRRTLRLCRTKHNGTQVKTNVFTIQNTSIKNITLRLCRKETNDTMRKAHRPHGPEAPYPPWRTGEVGATYAHKFALKINTSFFGEIEIATHGKA